MKYDAARAALIGLLDTTMTGAGPSTLVQYDNRVKVDMDSQTQPFVEAEVQFTDGVQASMGDAPLSRYTGALYLSVWTKESEGSKPGLVLLATLTDAFTMRSVGGVVTKAVRPLPAGREKGWYVQSIRVPFHFDD